jgi:hypothetical protein
MVPSATSLARERGPIDIAEVLEAQMIRLSDF